MKYDFYWFEEQEMNFSSRSFSLEAKRYLDIFFKSNLFELFDHRILSLQCEGIPQRQGNGNTMSWSKVDIKLNSISGLLFTFGLSYYNKQGLIVYPQDKIERDSLMFSTFNYPSYEELHDIKESWLEVIESLNTSKLINKKFRFPFNEKKGIALPDISMIIKADVDANTILQILNEAMEEWNKNIFDSGKDLNNKFSKLGVIHNIMIDKNERNRKVFFIDTGLSSHQGITYLLDKLDKSNLTIQKISIE